MTAGDRNDDGRELTCEVRRGPAVTGAAIPGHGRAWPYTGLVLGGGVSVAANIAHSYVPPHLAAAGWTPSPGAVLLAAFWPAAVFVAVEIMARATWAPGRRWVLVRWGGLAPVALVAAVVSYRHLAGLLGYYGEDPVTVAIGPLAVDGLMIVSTGALLAMSPHALPLVDLPPVDLPPVDFTGVDAAPVDPLARVDRLDPLARLDPVESSGTLDRLDLDSSRPAPSVDSTPPPLLELADALDQGGAASGAPLPEDVDHVDPRPQDVDHRPQDVERLKAAVMAGEITWPIKYEPARRHLRINIKYVKAAARHIHDEGWTPGQQALIDA